jgi:dUTP pyrophosphatase|tara:strand:- start:1280 stop:1702 length:423 start_codon:yes stop_codon:yes gene_type:complete
MSLGVKKLGYDSILPTRGSDGAVGYDLYSNCDGVIAKGKRGVVSTGIAVSLPPGVYGRVAPRSGLAMKNGIQIGAGVIDPDYTGEISVIIFNMGDNDFEVKKGARIAQLILERCETPPVEEIGLLQETLRGEGGFGSTGN